MRKLEFEADAFAFGDKLVAKWFPDKSDADKKGVMIIVTTGKDGAITGGPSFTQVPQASMNTCNAVTLAMSDYVQPCSPGEVYNLCNSKCLVVLQLKVSALLCCNSKQVPCCVGSKS